MSIIDQALRAFQDSSGIANRITSTIGNIDAIANAQTVSPVSGGVRDLGPEVRIGMQGGSDTRPRLRAMDGQADRIYGPNTNGNLLAILHETNGLLFPYTPTISVSQDVDYQSIGLVHTNNDLAAYTRSPSATIGLSARFAIQNQREGEYALAALHFLRVVSKMHFGESAGANAGLPPPVLIFEGYGNYMFDRLRVVVRSHSYSLDENVDNIKVVLPNGVAELPVLFTVQINLMIQQTPRAMRQDFDLEKFRTGELMTGKGGWL